MNQELESKVPVVEELNEIEKVEDVIKAEYTLTTDGTIESRQRKTENLKTV